MSRVAKDPIVLPSGVEATLSGDELRVKGAKGQLSMKVNPAVKIAQEDGRLIFEAAGDAENGWAQAGTARALANNLVVGVTQGFEKRLQLVGVGYRAQAQGRALNLSLGFSHPVVYQLPEGIEAETPTQTEIVIRGIDKQRVGQVSAEIREFRPPEPYKGKGVRYANEQVRRKEAKKK
ncbi:MAG: 50S ribosomal protein L6 [Pseudomonadales bacterium]|jgi:large subunit ribosomal protein L6|nr:50S ribosomal protein L6 [Pseudomonadales bacterium]